MPNPSIDFILNNLSHSYTMQTLAMVDDPIDGIVDVSATAVFYISQADIRSVFQVQTDSYDISDMSATDLHFYVFMNRWPATTILNPVNGMMDQPLSWSPIMNTGNKSKMLVKHDFIRYLALKLFNTAQAADLFNNESALITGLNAIGNTAYQQDISAALWKYSTTSSYPTSPYNSGGFVADPVTGLKSTTAEITTDDNLCFVIVNKLLQDTPHRFSNIVVDQYGLFPVPLLAGDTISFVTKINPVTGQNNLTGVPAFGGRSYQIKLIIDDGSHSNTTPTD
jgi:hypothetical protein